jgi:Kef-type K+ transport system membrane component KefB
LDSFVNIIFELALIFTGASILATIFLYLKQPIILAYIGLGMLVGPWGLSLINSPKEIESISHLGIILLMFLLGLELDPQKLLKLLNETALVTIISCVIFAFSLGGIAYLMNFGFTGSLITGLALMFSSTVISIKLIPAIKLHQKRIGELLISVLLFQDILAIILILFLYGNVSDTNIYWNALFLVVKAVVFAFAAFIFSNYLLIKIMRKFDVIQDYIFLITVGWCLLCAESAYFVGLSYEIGAFLGGIALGSCRVALIISEGLKPLREFFLILFFFSIGANFDFFVSREVLLPGILIAAVILTLKPIIFNWLFRYSQETKDASKELALRLGQGSEFSILVAYGAVASGVIEPKASYLIQLVAIITFIVSTYLVVYKYPTPIAVRDEIRQS